MNDHATPDGETDPFTLAEQKRWLDLARLGKEAWNTWAEAELKKPADERTAVDLWGQTIDISDFLGFVFSSDAYFGRAIFSATADFRGAIFSAGAYFGGATFSADADFGRATFSADAYFGGATLKSVWQMDGAKVAGSLKAPSADIQGHAHFTAIDFRIPPDLISTAFRQPPSFLESTFRYPCTNRFWGECSVEDGEARFRRLKQLAADSHDHELELRLFAHETKAKRFHSLHAANPLHWPGLVLNFGYEWVSDFGQSVLRPLGWLLVTVVCALFAYETMTERPDMLGRGLIEFSDAAKVAAVANVFPFAGQAVIGREIMTTGLCPMVEGTPEHLDCLTALYTISAVEGVFGLIVLFLIGLGLRNRFRIK